MRRHLRDAVCGMLVSAWAGTLSAATVKTAAYDNPADYDTGIRLDSSQFLGQSFIPADTIDLRTVSLFIGNLSMTVDSLTLEVRSDASGSPGALLGSATLVATNTAAQFIDFTFTAGTVSLSAGALYFLTTTNASAAGEGYIWEANRVLGADLGYSDGSAFFSSNQGTSWVALNSGINNFDMGFQVSGEIVPEPTSAALVGMTGLAFFFGRGRVRRGSCL